MEFDWTEDQQAFRKELATTLEAFVEPGFDFWDLSEKEAAQRSLGTCPRLAGQGWLTPAWPKEYGGRAATPWEQLIVAEEMITHGEPRAGQYMNVNFIGPMIMLYGTEAQKAYHLKRISAGSVIWCQGFSEPNAGSDLASLRTRAVLDGDHYVVNGEKIWTSYADAAEFCLLLVRTDPAAKKQEGISVLLAPVATPGITVWPVHGIVGDGAFNLVSFTDARIPVSCRLGPENQGWTIVRKALALERVGVARFARTAMELDRIAAWARENGRMDETNRRILARAYTATELARALVHKVVDDQVHGDRDAPSPYVYRAAVVWAERATHEAAFQVMGTQALAGGSLADKQFKWGIAAGVASGSYEMQLNLIASLILNMPRN
ncbi:MAG: acyl-CoA dehydrogenase family protein [Gammaproteobacteria bacterium]